MVVAATAAVEARGRRLRGRGALPALLTELGSASLRLGELARVAHGVNPRGQHGGGVLRKQTEKKIILKNLKENKSES